MNSDGRSTIVNILLLAVVAFVVYCGFIVGRFHFDFKATENRARTLLRDYRTYPDHIIFKKFKEYVDDSSIPLESEDVVTIEDGQTIGLSAKYEEKLTPFGVHLHTFKFEFEEKITKKQ